MSSETPSEGQARGFSGSGPLRGRGGSGSGGRSKDEVPNLADYPDEPQYDLATIVQLVGVRPMTLWAWEQQLGIPRPERVGESSGGTVRHYSERDLVASIWLRDQILAGVPPADAASLLMSSQHPSGGPGEGGPSGPSGPSGTGQITGADRFQVNSGPLQQSSVLGRASGPLSGSVSGPLSYPPLSQPPRTGSITQEPSSPSWSAYTSQPSGPLRGPSTTFPLGGGSTTWPGQAPVARGAVSGALRANPSGALAASVRGVATTGPGWPGAGAAPTAGRELRTLVSQLVRAFMLFDTYSANEIVDEALRLRQVETVCLGLLQPALARVNELGTRHELTIPEERYAINYVRGRLFATFANTREPRDGPTTIVTCGPRELYDVGALMLATFWRRAGLRVVFLGTDIDGPALVQAVQKRRPQVVCVAVTAPQRLRALARVAKEVARMDPPAPLFTFSGAVFARSPELQRKVAGIYLGDDPATATRQVMRLLGMEPPGLSPSGPAH